MGNRPLMLEEGKRIVDVYESEVLSRRTRLIDLPGRKCHPRIMYTFLGFEVKAGRRRMTCPDLSTARYITVFAELGMSSIRIPYDPTRTAALIPELESLLATINQGLAASEPWGGNRAAALRSVYRRVRRQLRRAEARTGCQGRPRVAD